jgi:PhnB protein
MSRTSIYLNFLGRTEEAFTYYAQVFGGTVDALQRMGDVPVDPGTEPLPEHERHLVMHCRTTLPGGVLLMGTDLVESMGHRFVPGNAITINVEPDTVDEGQRLFAALADDGDIEAPFQPMFWGDHWGCCIDRFGVRWMVNVEGAST